MAQDTVAEGEIPSFTYTVVDTAEWDYTFEGWSTTQNGNVLSSLPAATESVTYYAVVSKVKQVYEVNFVMNGAESKDPIYVEYGSAPQQPSNPAYSGHYFVSWCKDAACETEFDWTAPIYGNTTVYAKWNERVDLVQMLQTLLTGYKVTPYSFIPETLQPNYAGNLIDANDVVTDYTSAVNVSNIPAYGFGEQWNVVVSNVNQSMIFHNVLTVIDTISSTSITAFNNYMDSNPNETANHEFASGIYSITITFDGTTLYYVVDYTANIPVLGEQTVQIALSMDLDSSEKTVRMQIGDPNALTYTIGEDEYTFAIKYLGVRRAYFSVSRDRDGSVTGRIYEYLTVASLESGSTVDFYIGEDYTKVVGNKASGMVAFKGYICEVYKNATGNLVGYEVEESLSSIVYNTLWFDIHDVTGIDSIRFVEGVKEEGGEETEDQFFVNGSSTAWEAKKVGGLGLKMLSRRFDIGFRTQYFYSYNETTEEYEQIEMQVPMFFVQEEMYEDLEKDVKSTNDIDITIEVSTEGMEEILDGYDTLIPVYKENTESFSSEDIVQMIGEKITF